MIKLNRFRHVYSIVYLGYTKSGKQTYGIFELQRTNKIKTPADILSANKFISEHLDLPDVVILNIIKCKKGRLFINEKD